MNEDKVFEAQEEGIEITEQLRSELVSTWVTFDVEGWYTSDWGTPFSVWMPEMRVALGDIWLVAGDAHSVDVGEFSGQSGTADRCVTELATSDARASWSQEFSGYVPPGAAGPESEPSPAIVANIDAAEAQWEESGIVDYTGLMAFGDGGPATGTCSEHRLNRVVVVGGEVVQAVNVRDGCELDPALVASPDELFEAAREFSGTDGFRLELDPATGFPLSFGGGDRSAVISQFVERFEFETELAVLGWPAVESSLRDGRERWAEAGPDVYDFELDFACGVCGPTITGSVNGDDNTVVAEGWPRGFDEDESDWPPLWIEAHFDYVASYPTDNAVVAVFDSELGYLRDVWLDQNVLHGDSEIHVRVVPA